MCGIAGILCPPSGGSALRERLPAELERLAAALAHRGPDGHGTAVAGGAGLAHTRLAILDLSPTGAQPMWSADRGAVIAFNGEVYNFARLRAELEASGHRFAGTSDTEVVLALLARDGAEALARLDGMFALALLDPAGGRVLLARDRMGQKPLYVAEIAGGGWAFASELAPLLAVPGVDGGLDPLGLSQVLACGFVPAPLTLRRGIRQLEPGGFVELRAGGPYEERRFVAEPGPREPLLTGGDAAFAELLEHTLEEAVRDHLVADVPVGVLLSGGVDSSTIAALAARHVGRVKSFSVVHRDPRYDEREAARAVAEAIGSEHHEIELSDAPLTEEELDTVVDHHGDPFSDDSSLAVLRLSREMRRHVTVALSGDGADEVFAGYPRFGQLRYLSRLAAVPGPLLAAGSRLAGAVPGRRPRQVARALRVGSMAAERRAVAFTTLFWPEEQARLLRPEWIAERAGERFDAMLRGRGATLEPDAVASAHWLEQRLILPDNMLVKVDRMSMAASLEVRPPVLANAVTELAERLPFDAKHRGLDGKRVLKSVARRLVPPWVVDRPKKGFALPLLEHGGAVLEEASRFALESADSPLRRVFRAEALHALTGELTAQGEGRDPEDSPYRREHRRWQLTLLARNLSRLGGL